MACGNDEKSLISPLFFFFFLRNNNGATRTRKRKGKKKKSGETRRMHVNCDFHPCALAGSGGTKSNPPPPSSPRRLLPPPPPVPAVRLVRPVRAEISPPPQGLLSCFIPPFPPVLISVSAPSEPTGDQQRMHLLQFFFIIFSFFSPLLLRCSRCGNWILLGSPCNGHKNILRVYLQLVELHLSWCCPPPPRRHLL